MSATGGGAPCGPAASPASRRARCHFGITNFSTNSSGAPTSIVRAPE
jgi:hypothetical protein